MLIVTFMGVRREVQSMNPRLPPVLLIATSMILAGCLGFGSDEEDLPSEWVWVDPIDELENEDHSHGDLLAHRLATPNARLIDYHNLNCDGVVAPTGEADSTAGRPCLSEFKNTAPTPGDNSEVSIEGNFNENCVIHADGSGGCYAYVSSYNQFEILDISKPNDIRLLSTYYAEVARIIDIKVTPDNNWVLVNHEFTNSELDPIPNDDDANSGANRLDVVYVGDKTSPVRVAEWNNPPAGFHNQDVHVYCDWDDAPPPYDDEECHLFLFGADPIPESSEPQDDYKGTQIFYVPLGFESWNPAQNEEQQNSSREITRWGAYTPALDTTCGGTIFNHDNVYHEHPITGQKLLYISYWDAGLRIIDVSNPPAAPDPTGVSWPQNNEISRWLGCPSADSGWYGPDGGGHANMDASTWLSKEDGHGWIHYAVPYDHLICYGIWEGDPVSEWPSACGTGPDDSVYGVNWRHYTLIAPEYGSNQNHTGYIYTIDTTDPTKPFLVSKWKLPGEGDKEDGSSHPHHYIPSGYIFSPHNGDTGLRGHVYWTHYHAGAWLTDHGRIWEETIWKEGQPRPDLGFQGIAQMAETHTMGYFLAAGPPWIEDPTTTLQYDMADCWASCMIPFNWGLQFDPRGYVYVSEMVSGLYVIQFDEDIDPDHIYPPLWD